MTVRELAALDTKTLRDILKGHIKKPDGTDYLVFDQFYNFLVSLGRLQDDSKAVEVYAHDTNKDLQNYKAQTTPAVSDLQTRVAALEAHNATAPFQHRPKGRESGSMKNSGQDFTPPTTLRPKPKPQDMHGLL